MVFLLRHFSVLSAVLLACTGINALPAATTLAPVPTPAHTQIDVSFANQGSRWSKRHGRGHLDKRARRAADLEELDKRYWEVTSVWIGTFSLLSGMPMTSMNLIRPFLKKMNRRLPPIV
jgi:hypothetical protein